MVTVRSVVLLELQDCLPVGPATIGVVGMYDLGMSETRLPVLSELYTGERSWEEWIDHFESAPDVCGWKAAKKLKWLRVRLRGRAGMTFGRLPEATTKDYKGAKEALKNSF